MVLRFSLTIAAPVKKKKMKAESCGSVHVYECVCASGTSVCLCVSTGTPTIFRKLFGISGAVHPSSAEKNQTVEYRPLPREKCTCAK